MSGNTRTRTSLATASVVALSLMTGAAIAHVKDENAVLYDTTGSGLGQCVKGLARVAHGNYGKGFARSTTSSRENAFNGTCNYDKSKAAGRIAAGMWWYKWHSGRNEWLICAKFGYTYTSDVRAGLSVYHDFRKIRCGHGDYGTLSGNFVWWNDRWRGGELFVDHNF